jgi:ribokinase
VTDRRRGRVIVVGSVNIDLVAAADHLPVPGETVIGATFAQHHGGKGGNQAVAAARLGATVVFVGAVGDDALGIEARSALEMAGIDTHELRIRPHTATGVALIVVDAAGENIIVVASGANAGLTPDDVDLAMARLAPGPGDVVLVGHEIRTTAAAAALAAGHAGGAITILNPAPATGLDARTVDRADIVTPNEHEAAELQAAGILAQMTLVSLGRRGARLTTSDGSTDIPTIAVEVVDTVGAGDTLNGALAAALAEGRPLLEAAQRAVVAASLAITRAGAREGMPTASELDAAVTTRSAGGAVI